MSPRRRVLRTWLVWSSLALVFAPLGTFAQESSGTEPSEIETVAPASNPSLPTSCGIDMALVIDTSNSIDEGELAHMRSAFKAFAGEFLPETPTRIAVVSFADEAKIEQAMTSDDSLVVTAIEHAKSMGSTNWKGALAVAHGQFSSGAGPRVVVFASDGNPNYGGAQEAQALADAVTEANDLKREGIRIIALGIGDDLDMGKLEAISSGDAVFSAENFGSLSSQLRSVATSLCGGTINVAKIVDGDGNLETTNDQGHSKAGFSFTAAGETKETDAEGKVSMHASSSGPWSVIEGPKSGYEFMKAECRNRENEIVGTTTTNGIAEISLHSDDIVSCVFYNKAPASPQPPPQSGGGPAGGGSPPPDQGGGGVVSGPLAPTFGGGMAVIPTSPGVVLGTTTVASTTCSQPLLKGYLRIGWRNDKEEVKKLQSFLNEEMNARLPVTGYFGAMTYRSVEEFQVKYWQEILLPWVPHGLPTDRTPTGFVYKTTSRWINMLHCPALALPMPILP